MGKWLANLDADKLTPMGRAILIAIVEPINGGWKETELAKTFGRTPSWVSERLSELRQEVSLQGGAFPPMSDFELDALEADIARRGIQVPIIVDENLRIIDGRARYIVAERLGVECPYVIREGLSDQERRDLAISLNANRRHLTRQQKRKLVEVELSRDPTRSDGEIASLCGVDPKTTVSTVRQFTEAAEASYLEAKAARPQAA